jgi:hypothetical protein
MRFLAMNATTPGGYATPARHVGMGTEVFRAVNGLYFLVMALGVNLFSTLRGSSVYSDMADLAVLRPYEWLLRDVIQPVATPFTLLLIAFEVTVALLMLGKARAVKPGLLAAIVFQLALIPGLGLYGLVNIPVAAGQVWLLRHDFDRTVPEVLGSWWAAHRPHVHA